MSLIETTKKRVVPVSLFQLFSIGIGPSSSHTVGPMRAARSFAMDLADKGLLFHVGSMTIELFGSLAMTGKGHATDMAVLLGLLGETPEAVDPNEIALKISLIEQEKRLSLLNCHSIIFDSEKDLLFCKGKRLSYHSNALRLKAYSGTSELLFSDIYYSVGGGFIVTQREAHEPELERQDDAELLLENAPIPYVFQTCAELQNLCTQGHMSIAELMWENEKTWKNADEIRKGILNIWQIMQSCVERGLRTEGILPGGLGVKRRAPELYRKLLQNGNLSQDPSELMDWVSLFALAVNEENASGGRVITAPTNGASGIIPAVLHYYQKFIPSFSEEGVVTFFLTAAAIGILYKEGASLSAAEMGCQGEVGVATSMAAAGLTAALGGSNAQIENAAEIGMEHNLGLTCDPIAGLVQIPCIERNTMGALKAINAHRLAMHNEGDHRVKLDHVIAAMRQTGEDMQAKYKETAEGGLAFFVPVNLPEC